MDIPNRHEKISIAGLDQILTLAFSKPDIIEMDGLLDVGIINRHIDILSEIKRRHYPKLSDLEFRGLMIKEELRPDLQRTLLPSTATILFLAVAGAKLIYGDWATAWNVGSFLVSLVTLLWMWASH
ncbi:hypothetical protein B7463_g10885, partial [Scytalidium lignicola]